MKKKLSGVLLLVLIAFGFLMPNISHATPADTIGGPVAIIRKVTDVVQSKFKDTLQKVGSALLKGAISKALNKIAIDAATYAGSGGEGQKPLFVTKGLGAYMKDIGDNAIGDAMEQFAQGTGINICSPNLDFKLKIGLGLSALTEQKRPSDSACKFSTMSQNWKNDINAKWAAFQSPDLLKNVAGSFSLSAPAGINASYSVLSGAADTSKTKVNDATNGQLIGKGWLTPTNIGGQVTTAPGQAEADLANIKQTQQASLLQTTGNVFVDAGKVFVNQLAVTAFNRALKKLATGDVGNIIPGVTVGSDDWWHKQIMAVTTCDRTPLDGCNASSKNDQDQSKCYAGYSCNSDCKCVDDNAAVASTDNLYNPNAVNNTGGIKAITQSLQTFAKPKFNVQADLNVLASLNSCPDAGPYGVGPTDCVLDDKFMQAVQEKKTVAEAISEGTLDPTWKMTADDNKTYQDAYTMRDIKILGQYRILPVGWQQIIATSTINKNPNITLGDAMACFDPNDAYTNFSPNFNSDGNGDIWCQGLVDPNWVLKAPQTQCAKLGVGNQLLSKDVTTEGVLITRNDNYCADVQSCISENKDGSCNKFGYCTQEKRTWNFASDACDPVYNTCNTYVGSDGTQASYLANTLDYSNCTGNQAGCKSYATTGIYSSSSNTMNWGTDNLKYFNKTVGICDAGNEGCSGFIRTNNYHNFLVNGDFEDNSNLAFWGVGSGGISITTSGYASAQAIAFSTNGLGRTIAVGPADYNVADEAYTLSFYSNCTATTTAYLGTANNMAMKSLPFSSGNTWSYHYLTNVYPHDAGTNQISFSIIPESGSCVVDKIKLEKGLDSSAYSEYGTNDTIYEKILPKYLESVCYVNTGSAKNYNLQPFAPAICQKFAKKCNADEAGCEQYKAAGDALPVQAVAKAADYCTAECVGYDTYIQRETAFNSSTAANIIPKTASACSAAAVGCNEFTNLDAVAKGGEGKEYYTYLRQCVKPSETKCGDFYTWENSGGQQSFKTYNLELGAVVADGPMTSGATAYAFAGNKGGSDCSSSTYKLLPSDPNYNSDCREFYDKAGNISYANLGQTITCNDNCLPYRVTDNIGGDKCTSIGGTADTSASSSCIVYAVPGEGRTCSAAENGCREYNGNYGNNIKIVKSFDFENGVNPFTFDTQQSSASVVPESNIRDGHSLKIVNEGSIGYQTSQWQKLTFNLNLADKTIAFFKDVLNKLSLAAFAASTVPDHGVAVDMTGSAVQGAAYTIKFLAKASYNSSINIDFTNGKNAAQFLSTAQEGASAYIPGDNTWRLYQMYLPSLDHDVSKVEGLVLSTGVKDVYIDNIVLTQITDRYYLLKDSWKTPDSCYYDIFGKYQGTNYNLGCNAYADRDNSTHYLRNFSKICGATSVGCEAVVDTGNSSAATTTPNYIYAIYDSTKLCGADNKGCSRLGQALLANRDVSIQNVYSDVYVKDNPDNYTTPTKAGITCSSDAVGCEEFKSTDGSLNYFKNPGSNTCEWRAGKGDPSNKWYRSASMRCDYNTSTKPGIDAVGGAVTEQYNRLCLRDTDCTVGATKGKCIVDTNDYLCPVEMAKTLGFGGTAIYQPSGATGICKSDADTCTELIDPQSGFMPNLVLDPSGYSGTYKSDKWSVSTAVKPILGNLQFLEGQNINPLLAPNKLYKISVEGVAPPTSALNGDVVLYCNANVKILRSDNSLTDFNPATDPNYQGNIRVSVDQNSVNNSITFYTGTGDSNVKSFSCAVYNPDKGKIISLKEVAIDYQLAKDLDRQSCNGTPNTDSGCVLFNERGVAASSTAPFGQKLATLGYNAGKSYDYSRIYSTCGGVGQVPCNSNSLIKATPDRSCAKWLACDDYALDGNNQVCSHYAECTAADDSGQCNTFLQTSPNTAHVFSSTNDQNSSGFSLLNNFYFKDMKQVGSDIFHQDFEKACVSGEQFCTGHIISSPDDLTTLKKNSRADYPGHGKSFMAADNVAAIAGFDVAPNTDYYINFLVNGDDLIGRGLDLAVNDSKKTDAGGCSNLDCVYPGGASSNWGHPVIYRSGGSALNVLSDGKKIIDGSGWQRMVAKIHVPTGTTKINLQFYTSESGYYVYIDDINIESVLQVADNTLIAKDCRLYPKTDSLTCESDNKSVVANGLYGYCLQYDSKNPSVCLMWYPVGGDGSSVDNYSANNMFTGFTSTGLTPHWCMNVAVNATPVEHREMRVLSYLGYCTADTANHPTEAAKCNQQLDSQGNGVRDYFGRSLVYPALNSVPATKDSRAIFPGYVEGNADYDYFTVSYEAPGTHDIWQALIQVPKNSNSYTFYDLIGGWGMPTTPTCEANTDNTCVPKGSTVINGGWWAKGSSYTQSGNSNYQIVSADPIAPGSANENCISLDFVSAGNCGGGRDCTNVSASKPVGGAVDPSKISICVNTLVNGWYKSDLPTALAGFAKFHVSDYFNGTYQDFFTPAGGDYDGYKIIYLDQGEKTNSSPAGQPSLWNGTMVRNNFSDEPLTCNTYTTPPPGDYDPLITWYDRAKDTKTNWSALTGSAYVGYYTADTNNAPFSAVSTKVANCYLKSGTCGLPYGCSGTGCRYLSATGGVLSLNSSIQDTIFNTNNTDGYARFKPIIKNLFLNAGVDDYTITDGNLPNPINSTNPEHIGKCPTGSPWCATWPTVDGPVLMDKKGALVGGAMSPGYYTLKFGVTVNSNQLPLYKMRIDWGDGSNVEKTVIDPRNGAAPFVFVHYYSAAPTTDIKITVMDNWRSYGTATRINGLWK
ncbi:MAG: hypothetical protein WCK37_04415 [Candidatus Falkowbacteria bacterium]